MQRLILVVLALILAACSAVPLAAPTPEPAPTPAPCSVQSQAFIESFDALWNEWSDKVELADNTARMSLSPIVSDMQDIRRDTQALEAPDCAILVREQAVESMDLIIDAFIAFMGQESNINFSRAAREMVIAGMFFDDLKADKPLPTKSVQYQVSVARAANPEITYSLHNGNVWEGKLEDKRFQATVAMVSGETARLDVNVRIRTQTTCRITVDGEVIAETTMEKGGEFSCEGVVP